MIEADLISSVNALNARLDTLWSFRPYEMVYISYGSKYNDNHVTFSQQASIKYATNASYQMVPNFIRSRESIQHVLVICIDDFSNEDLLAKNRQIVRGVLSNQENNVDIILFDNRGNNSLEFLCALTEYFIHMVDYHNIDPKKCMFCNYIRHRSPNQDEWALEQLIPKKIHELFEKFDRYSDCFYNWFGYSMFTYNFIYNYNRYMYLINWRETFRLFSQTLVDVPLSYMNIMKVLEHQTTQTLDYPSRLKHFAENCVDITTFCPEYETIALPLSKYFD